MKQLQLHFNTKTLTTHRAREASARPKRPYYQQTGPPTRTKKTPQPPKDSTAGLGAGDQKKGGASRRGGGLAGLKVKLRTGSKGNKDIGVIHVSSEDLQASWDNPKQLWQPPPTSPPAQREEHRGEQHSNCKKEENGGQPPPTACAETAERGRKSREGRREHGGCQRLERSESPTRPPGRTQSHRLTETAGAA
uniref:Uncharacterized protein n=1 Tax=Oryza glumipatula TaxID=40148 RepID=A0A0E0B0W4_9ORYZ